MTLKITHDMIWTALDNLARDRKISPSRMAQISGLDLSSFNKCKRLSPDGKEHWPSVRTLTMVFHATNTTWSEFEKYIPDINA